MKIGLIAGSGSLPQNVIDGARDQGHDVFVVALKGFSNPEAFDVAAKALSMAEFGRITKALRAEECSHVCFAGHIARPDFKKLKPDLKGLSHLPGAALAARDGDDSLLNYVLQAFEKEGFSVIPPQDLCASLLLPDGHLGDVRMNAAHREDVEKACRIATEIGGLDIGQGAVVCRGLVLAVEAQEGTDAMLSRVAGLPVALRGNAETREGVLAKMLKPGQETRVDMPTIGPSTIRLAAAAGLAGIAAESGRAFIIDREDVIAAANEAGIFILGIPPAA